LTVARDLLGKYIVRKTDDGIIAGIITETEAYVGKGDLASHASRGRTKRTEMMFGEPGRYYVYLIYGMYYCLNVVTERKEYPAAVLIRAVRVKDVPYQSTDGPGKLCRYFCIDKTLNGQVVNNSLVWIEDRGVKVPARNILRAKRIGVEYAGTYKDKLWRYLLKISIKS